MKYVVHLSSGDGEYTAECPEMGLTSHGLSATNALDQMREAIRYGLEYCPCSHVDEDHIELDVRTVRL